MRIFSPRLPWGPKEQRLGDGYKRELNIPKDSLAKKYYRCYCIKECSPKIKGKRSK